MSLAGFGYFAGGLTGGYLKGRENQQAQARTDADVGFTNARTAGINNEVAAWKDTYEKLKDKYPELAGSINFSHLQPQQPAAPPMNVVPGLTPPAMMPPTGPVGGLTPPYAPMPMRPAFGAY